MVLITFLKIYTVQVSQCYYQMRPSELIRDEIAMVTLHFVAGLARG